MEKVLEEIKCANCGSKNCLTNKDGERWCRKCGCKWQVRTDKRNEKKTL